MLSEGGQVQLFLTEKLRKQPLSEADLQGETLEHLPCCDMLSEGGQVQLFLMEKLRKQPLSEADLQGRR